MEPSVRTTWIDVRSGEHYDVFVGYPSRWCNPFRNRKDLTRRQKIWAFWEYLLERPDLLVEVHKLRGLVLACYCFPLECHSEILAMFADSGFYEPGEGPYEEALAKLTGRAA